MEFRMRKLVYGLAAAAAIAIATPAAAQVGFYAGPGGAGVEFGAPHHYYGEQHRWDHGRHEGWRRGRHQGWYHRHDW
jgi:hypothetical protein